MPATVDLVLPWVEGSAAPNDNRRQEAGDRRPETGGRRQEAGDRRRSRRRGSTCCRPRVPEAAAALYNRAKIE